MALIRNFRLPTEIELYRRKTINVQSNEGTSISFVIRPKRVGFINVKVTARTSQAGDGIEQLLKVEPEGETQYENSAILIDLRDTNKYDGNITIDIPKNAVPDSTKIDISVIGTCILYYSNILYKGNTTNFSNRLVPMMKSNCQWVLEFNNCIRS